MTDEIKEMLFDAWDWCDEKDKSTEFMLSYMSDIADIDYMEAVKFVGETTYEDRLKWRRKK